MFNSQLMGLFVLTSSALGLIDKGSMKEDGINISLIMSFNYFPKNTDVNS